LGGLVAVRGLAPASLSGFAVGYVGADGRERHDGLVGTGDPTPMVFLIHAAHYLDHPEPGQLLRRHHPLFRWAETDDLPSWRWQNSSEPDGSIYAALRAGDIPATGPLI
jgi:hypothetical protein